MGILQRLVLCWRWRVCPAQLAHKREQRTPSKWPPLTCGYLITAVLKLRAAGNNVPVLNDVLLDRPLNLREKSRA